MLTFLHMCQYIQTYIHIHVCRQIYKSMYVCLHLLLIYAVIWDLHVEFNSSAVRHTYTCSRHICSETYASNVKWMYTSICGDIVDSSEFI